MAVDGLKVWNQTVPAVSTGCCLYSKQYRLCCNARSALAIQARTMHEHDALEMTPRRLCCATLRLHEPDGPDGPRLFGRALSGSLWLLWWSPEVITVGALMGRALTSLCKYMRFMAVTFHFDMFSFILVFVYRNALVTLGSPQQEAPFVSYGSFYFLKLLICL